jgi:hypothetical protein
MERRFRFRLRTLFIVMTIAAVVCAYTGRAHKIATTRREMATAISKAGGTVNWENPYDPGTHADIPWIRRVLFDDAAAISVWLPPDEFNFELDYADVRAAFPEVKTIGRLIIR